MTFLLQLAARNLARNLRRTLLSMAAIVAGVAVLVLGRGFIGGLDENIIRAQVDSFSAHVLIRPKDYPTTGLSHPVDDLFRPPAELVKQLDDKQIVWTERLLFTPRVVKGSDSVRVRAIGFDPVKDELVFPRDTWHVTGEVPKTFEEGVLLSQGVAALLGSTDPASGEKKPVGPGDYVVFETRTPAGAINALELRVSGVFTAGNSALDRFGVFVPWPAVEKLMLPEGAVSHLAMRLPARDGAPETQKWVSALVPDLEVVTWIDETKDMLALQNIRRKALDILVFMLMGMSATGIANTVLMAAYERVREIGTLQALGMTRARVIQLFVLEGGFMGVIGGAFGVALGGGLVAWYSKHGIDLTSALKTASNLPVATMLYLQFNIPTMAMSFLFGVVVAVGASIWPAFVASRMSPADAVKADA